MKQLLIIFTCCYSIIFNIQAQNYLAEYQSKDNKARLTFNAMAWLYDVTASIEFKIESYDVDVSDMSPETQSYSSFNYRSLDKNYYLDNEIVPPILKCVIKGDLIRPEWTILSDSIKTIENYTCLMAKGHVRGRDYTVWFTPDIPVSAGPWKLWGLPGLIVSARSDDWIVDEITMISLKQTDVFPEEPVVKKTVSPEEFKVLFQEEAKKNSRMMRSIGGDGMYIDVSINTKNHPDKSLLE